jgi:hypothetical protein
MRGGTGTSKTWHALEQACAAFHEAIAPATTPERKQEIEGQLVAYCGLDTFAMVRLWEFFCGRPAGDPHIGPA